MVIGWRASYRAAEAFFLDLSDTKTNKAQVAAWAQALVVYLAVLSSRLRTDLEIQHPLRCRTTKGSIPRTGANRGYETSPRWHIANVDTDLILLVVIIIDDV